MFDLKLIRENLETVRKGLLAKNVNVNLDEIVELDQKRRQSIAKLDELRTLQNQANDEISQILKAKNDPKERIAGMKKISSEIDELEPLVKEFDQQLDKFALILPNLPHESEFVQLLIE